VRGGGAEVLGGRTDDDDAEAEAKGETVDAVGESVGGRSA